MAAGLLLVDMNTTNTTTGAENTTAAQEDRLVRLPWGFFQDHQDRDLPTPEPVRWNKKSVWVSLDDPHLDDLIEDAEYYGDKNTAPDGDGAEVFHYAAKRLLKAYHDQVEEEDAE
jgi:hypothetical protein